MHEEVEHTKHLIDDKLEEIIKMVATNSSDLKPLRALPALKSGGGKLSVADKQRLKEMTENFDRVSNNQKRVMEQLRNINMEGVKQQLIDLEAAMASKSDIEDVQKRILDFSQVVAKMNKTVVEVEKESAGVKQFTERKIEGNRDILMKHTE